MRRRVPAVALVLAALCPAALVAAFTAPNSFTNGQLADATAVNQNFAAVGTALDGHDTRLAAVEQKAITTGPWYDLLAVSGYTHLDAKCRVVNGWIEFRGYSSVSLPAGWPSASPLLLPTQCRPLSTRYTETPCHAAATPKPALCNNDYGADGRVGIHIDAAMIQIRWEGLRIWQGP